MSDRDDDKPAKQGEKKTLTDDQIKTRPKLGRRSLLGVAAGLAGAAAALGNARPGHALSDHAGQATDATAKTAGGFQEAQGPTDSDGGAYADPAGQGRGGVRTGLTDSDGGQWADMPGGGRWGSGLTDSDNGPYIRDQGGNGRRGF